MNYTGPKVKLSRKIGIAITPKAATVLERKNYAPGQHGPMRRMRRGQKISNYKRQLLEKQKLRFQYNIHEKQLRNYYDKAARKKGITAENLIQLLETRLDNLVLRGGLARTIYQARQLVSHGHFLVNSRPVNLPAYSVQVNDIVSLQFKSKKLDVIHNALQHAHPPQYLELSKADLSIQLKRLPARKEVPIQCDVVQVIEFYSK